MSHEGTLRGIPGSPFRTGIRHRTDRKSGHIGPVATSAWEPFTKLSDLSGDFCIPDFSPVAETGLRSVSEVHPKPRVQTPVVARQLPAFFSYRKTPAKESDIPELSRFPEFREELAWIRQAGLLPSEE